MGDEINNILLKGFPLLVAQNYIIPTDLFNVDKLKICIDRIVFQNAMLFTVFFETFVKLLNRCGHFVNDLNLNMKPINRGQIHYIFCPIGFSFKEKRTSNRHILFTMWVSELVILQACFLSFTHTETESFGYFKILCNPTHKIVNVNRGSAFFPKDPIRNCFGRGR